MESRRNIFRYLVLTVAGISLCILYSMSTIPQIPCVCPNNITGPNSKSQTVIKELVIDKSSLAYISGRPSVQPYMEDFVQCHPQVFYKQADVDEHRAKINASSEICTPQLFEKYFSEKNHFYSHGTWLAPSEYEPDGSVYYPDHCVFDKTKTAPGELTKCLQKRNIKKIFIYGDSNGFRFFQQTLEFFRNRSEKCEVKRIQEDTKYGSPAPYFQVPGSPLIQKFKGCWECLSQVQECYNVDSYEYYTVTIEYIGIGFIVDRHLKKFSKEELLHNSTIDEDTVIEYIFQKYFPYYGFPDLWILPAMIHHEAAESTYDAFENDMKDFMRLVDRYLPPTTDLMFLTNVRMCAFKSGWHEIQTFLENHGLTKNKVMHIMNQVVFDVVKDKLVKPGNNIYGFLDMGEVTCPVVCNWHHDGAHMLPVFYNVMFDLLMQYLCAE